MSIKILFLILVLSLFFYLGCAQKAEKQSEALTQVEEVPKTIEEIIETLPEPAAEESPIDEINDIIADTQVNKGVESSELDELNTILKDIESA